MKTPKTKKIPAALLDDDDAELVLPVKKKKAVPADLLDDDEQVPATEKVKPVVAKAAPPPIERKPLPYTETPAEFHQTAIADGDRVVILRAFDTKWEDLLVYHSRMSRCMHVRRKDLYPSVCVDRVIEFLQRLKN